MKMIKLNLSLLTVFLLFQASSIFAINNNDDTDIERIEVSGEDSIAFYRSQVVLAENEFFELFNQLTTESDYKVECEQKNRHAFTRIKQRDCESGYESRIKFDLTQKSIQMTSKQEAVGTAGGAWMQNIPMKGEYYVSAKKIREDQLQEFKQKIMSSEELQQKFIKLHEAMTKYEESKNAK